MYGFYLAFEWLGRHWGWGALAVGIIVTTIALNLYFERRTPR